MQDLVLDPLSCCVYTPLQIGSGDRSERIRTYNFPQGRVTDHRVGVTLHALTQVLDGDGIDDFVDALRMKQEMNAINALSKS